MAKKKKRRPHAPPGQPAPPGARQAAARRAHKDEARRAREAAARRARRSEAIRRSLTLGVVVAVAIGVYLYLTRVAGPQPIPETALAAAQAAGCDPEPQTPATDAPGGLHLESGQSYAYDQHPATSGYHDPSPLPPTPHVYTTPVPETQAVHNLEHAYVLIYYRPDGKDSLPKAVVDDLSSLAKREEKVIMAPYGELPGSESLALAAWNKLWTCPSTVTPEQARAIATGFIQAYRGTSNAPEPEAG